MEIQKGEVLLIRSNKSFEERSNALIDSLSSGPDGIYVRKKIINIEDVRDFQNEFQKNSQGTNIEFKKIGVIVFDDISVQAQNSLLKIFEDIDSQNCIVLLTNKNIKLLPTILSRVVSIDEEEKEKNKKPELPDLTDKDNPIDKQQVIEWITYTIENSKINKDKKPLIWINSPSPNIKYIIEYVTLFY